LDAFVGRKVFGRSTLGRATTAARGAGRILEEGQDAQRAKDNVQALGRQLSQLQGQVEQETEARRPRSIPRPKSWKHWRSGRGDLAMRSRFRTTFWLVLLAALFVWLAGLLGGMEGAVLAFMIALAVNLVKPFTGGLQRLFSTRPPLQERIKRLQAQAIEAPRPSGRGLDRPPLFINNSNR